MNKRSAMMVAAGLVLAMLVAGMAVASGFTGSEASATGSGVTGQLQRREPKVRTITETITVHRDAKPSGSSGVPAPVVITQAPSAPTSQAVSDPSSFDDDEYEGEDDYEHDDGDHEYEHEDGLEVEDHEDD